MSTTLESELGFRIRGANVEFLEPGRSGARPATEIEKILWRRLQEIGSQLVDTATKLRDERRRCDGYVEEIARMKLDEREARVRKLAGG